MFFLNLFLAWFFYLLGDFFSKIPFYFFYVLYTKCMKFSLKFDEKCGYKVWKE
jgi:hypothetical protein